MALATDIVNLDRRDAAALLLLLALPWLFFAPVLAPGAARAYFAEGDFVDQFYAFASFEARQLAAGHLPLWNPYAYSGSPFWADAQSAVAYPPSLATVLTFGLVLGRLPYLALECEAIAHFVLAGWFTYAFARRSVGRRGPALLAALAFTYGGYLTGYPPLQLAVLESNVWLPAALLGATWIVSRPAGRHALSRRGLAVCSIALALGVLAGHPQSALYLTSAVAAWFAWSCWRSRSRAITTVLGFAAALALGAGLSAAGWLPALDYLRLSNRAASDYTALAHGFPARELAGLVLPGITLWSPLYVGVLPLLLALAALRRWLTAAGEQGDVGFWTTLGGAALALSLGGSTFVFDVFYLAAPGFDLFRGQERAAFLISFALAMLAAHGARDLLRRDAETARVVAVGAIVLALAGGLLAASAAPQMRSPGVHLAIFSALTAALALLWRSRAVPPRWLLPAAAALCILDLFVANAGTDLQADAPGELTASPLIEELRSAPGRVHNEDRLPRNFGVLHAVESTYGASPMRPASYDALYEGLGQADEARLWRLLAVDRVLTTRSRLPVEGSTHVVADGPADTYVHELPPAPYAWLATDALIEPQRARALTVLADPGFDVERTVVLEDPAAARAPAGRGQTVSRVERAAGTVTVAVSGPEEAAGEEREGAWLVLSEVHHPGWRAEVDGRGVPLWRADVALVAVRVPPGDHQVSVRFAAPLVTAGIVVSLASLLVLVLGLSYGNRRARRSPTSEVKA